MTELKRFSPASSPAWRRAVLIAFVLFFLGLVAKFYVPGKGFSALIIFGGNYAEQAIPELKAIPHFTDEQSFGYDAQWYAQLAIRPDPRDPELSSSIDNLSYRARRILFCWTAYVLGFGQPAWILQIYALQNVVAWLALGWLLLRWFPPDRWENVARWAAVMFSFGMCVSVRESLVDGPSLLLIALGVALVEQERRNLAALVLGLSGLAKETNILGAAALAWPWPRTRSDWFKYLARGVAVALPLGLWILWLHASVTSNGPSTGLRAFAPPFVAYVEKFRLTLHELFSTGWAAARSRGALYTLVSLAVQFAVIVFRPRIQNPWWRIGAIYAALMIFLGGAVWEGYPGAAGRVLLPLTLAFNILLPYGRKAWLLLILGNLTVLSSWQLSYPPQRFGYRLRAPADLLQSDGESPPLSVTYGPGWYGPEGDHWDFWRWSQAESEVYIYNPTTGPLVVSVKFKINAASERKVAFGNDEGTLWSGTIGKARQPVYANDLILVPGDNRLWWKAFISPEELRNPGDDRRLAFRVYNLQLTVRRIEPAKPK